MSGEEKSSHSQILTLGSAINLNIGQSGRSVWWVGREGLPLARGAGWLVTGEGPAGYTDLPRGHRLNEKEGPE